jgi:hypothetical protein
LGQAGASYTLYTSSSIDRDKWKDAIISAKREHSSAMYALNAEPFRMKVVADYAFGYDSSYSPKLPVFTAASAVDRALRETGNQDKPRPLVKSYINCGVSFVFADGNEYCMLGLDYGVYIHDGKPDSIWRRCLEITKVTQIDILEELNVVLLIADKALIYYHLDEVIGQTVKQSGSDKPPMGYRLSQHRRVGFFNVGYMKQRTLVFYKRTEGLSSTFKVLEPIKEKGSQRRRSKMSFSRGVGISSTEFFRETDKFYVPTEAFGLSIFKSTFSVHTAKGFELLSLDSMAPQSVPVLSSITSSTLAPILKASNGLNHLSVETFKKRIENARPVGMFRVSGVSLVLCYEDMAIYCDNYGNLTGPAVIVFVCKAKTVAVQLPYLVAFNDTMIEIRRLDRAGQLKQVISGRDIRAIDTKEGQIMAALAHPKLAGRQLVVELIGNEFVVDDDLGSSLSGL